MWKSLRHLILPLVTAMLTTGCHVTMADLQARNPHAETLEVPCRPSQFPDSIQVWAVRPESGDIFTDEQPDELQRVAPFASVFIHMNEEAPYSNAEIMASRYGLFCPNMAQEKAPESEPLRKKDPCPAEVTQSDAVAHSNLMAEPGKPDCNPPVPAKKIQRVVYVCARPLGVGPNVGRWASRDSKGQLLINNEKVFVDAVAQADIIFIFDANAAPESVYWFVNDPAKLQCPDQPPPMPYNRAKAGGRLDFMAAIDTLGRPPSGPPTGANGAGKTTETSSPTGKGPPLSTFETMARNLNLLAALANADTSGNAKHPEGDRNGMVNGTNVGGWSFPALQAGLSAIQILTAVGMSPKAFVERIAAATKGGQRVLINEADKAALQMADELIKEAGQYELAKGLQEISAVLPFKLGQKFTASLESKFQAHKIFEKQAFEYFEEVLAKDGLKDALEKAPSVILTDVEHQAITNKLNEFWRKVAKTKPSPKPAQVKKDLLELYQKVYQDHPHWMQAIQHLFNQIP